MHDAHVAVYWDFENIHASLYDELNGTRSYSSRPRRGIRPKQLELVQMDAVINHILTSIGDIAIHRAYANWSRFGIYRKQLLDHSIDLIQMFGRGSRAKNSVDIRIVLDAMQDVLHFPHLSDVVVISGDSDYVSLAQTVHRSGKRIFGVGVKGTTSSFWMRACDDFKFYGDLLQARTNGSDDVGGRPVGQTRRPVLASDTGIVAPTNSPPTHNDSVNVVVKPTLTLVEKPVVDEPLHTYQRAVSSAGLKIPDFKWRDRIIEAMVQEFASTELVPTWEQLERAIMARIGNGESGCTISAIKIVRHLCFRAGVFTLEPNWPAPRILIHLL